MGCGSMKWNELEIGKIYQSKENKRFLGFEDLTPFLLLNIDSNQYNQFVKLTILDKDGVDNFSANKDRNFQCLL
jgi:hypothetical protein